MPSACSCERQSRGRSTRRLFSFRERFRLAGKRFQRSPLKDRHRDSEMYRSSVRKQAPDGPARGRAPLALPLIRRNYQTELLAARRASNDRAHIHPATHRTEPYSTNLVAQMGSDQ
jgi:hypothetical protein